MNRRGAFFNTGDPFLVFLEFGVDLIQSLNDLVQAAVYAVAQIVDSFVLNDGGQCQCGYDRQRNLNEGRVEDGSHVHSSVAGGH